MYIYVSLPSPTPTSLLVLCTVLSSVLARARAPSAPVTIYSQSSKRPKPTNDSDRLAILLNGVCLASHCHDDGELAGILWTHQARVHEAE